MRIETRQAYRAFNGRIFKDRLSCENYESEMRSKMLEEILNTGNMKIADSEGYQSGIHEGFFEKYEASREQWFWFGTIDALRAFLRYLATYCEYRTAAKDVRVNSSLAKRYFSYEDDCM